jgi:hypothetical protein
MKLMQLLAIESQCLGELAMGEQVPSEALLSLAKWAGIDDAVSTAGLDALKTEARRRLDALLDEMGI